MKAIKYLIVGAAVFSFTLTASAQESKKAVVDQVTKIIKSKTPDAAKQIKEVIKDYKKDAEVLTAVGRAYLDVKDTANADMYADQAIKRDQKYGNAYVLKGDVQVFKDNGGTASQWYEQAVYFEPKNPEGYRRYAQINSKASPSASVEMLERLRQARPDYPVDIISAEIYDRVGNVDKALSYYDKVDRSKMSDAQLASYSLNHMLKGNFDKSLEISKFGLESYPRNPGLNRITFYDLTNLKQYAEALKYADALFNKSDSAKITPNDYLYYGYAYAGNGQDDKSIDMFLKSIELNKDNEADRLDALKHISDSYLNKKDYDNAAKYYIDYLKSAKKTAYELSGLAKLYQMQAQESTGQAKLDALNKADKVYEEIENTYPDNKDFAIYNRALIQTELDPDTKSFLAKPFCEQLVSELSGMSDISAGQKTRLGWACAYLAYYYYTKNDKASCKDYCNKALEADPNNAQAKQMLPYTEK